MKLDDKYFINTEKHSADTLDALLTEDEKILWRGKPKKGAYILEHSLRMMPFALIWLLFDGFFIWGIAQMKNLDAGYIAFIVVFLLFHLAPVWIWLHNTLTAAARLKQTEYAFTNQRIIIKSGFIGKNVQNIFYSDLTGVNLKVGVIDRMFKVGDIYLTSNGRKDVLEDIPDPFFVTSRLQKIAHDIKTDIEYPNNLRPQSNDGYQTDYKE